MSYDFAIIGAGAAGTLLAMELVNRPSLSTKKVLIVDREGGDYRIVLGAFGLKRVTP